MRSIKNRAVVAIGGLLIATLAACGGSSSGETDDGTIRIAYTAGSLSLQVHIADKMGFFKDRGLDVELTEGLDLPTWIASLDKQYDIAWTTSGIFVTGANKFDLVAVGGGQVNRADVLGTPLVTNDPSIDGPEDLEGKRIGVVTLTGTTPASLAYLVDKAGGDPDTLDLVQVPFGSQGDQLAAGQVDAVVSSTPFASALEQADPANRLVFDVPDSALRDIAPDQQQTAMLMFASSRTWADAHPDEVTAFQEALQEAIDWIAENEQEAIDKMAEWLGLPVEVLEAAPFPPPVSATVSRDEVEPVLSLYEDRGLLEEEDVPELADRFPG